MDTISQVRLVVSDMDGTLLDDAKRFPPDFKDVVEALNEKGIRFTAASGRSFATLRNDFARVLGEETANKMDYICDNGAFVVANGKPTDIHFIDRQVVNEVVLASRNVPDITMLLCGMNGSYHLPYTPVFEAAAESYHINNREVDDLTKVNDDIFKIAICDLRGPENNIFPVLNPLFGDRYALQISGPQWMDIMNPGVDKGTALVALQQRLGISRDETMAFGDFCNDIGLLKNARYSFAMANSHPDVLLCGRYVAANNNEYGVTVTARRLLLEGRSLPEENPAFQNFLEE